MKPMVMNDLLQLATAFFCLLGISVLVLLILFFGKRIAYHLQEAWEPWFSRFRDVDWIGLFILIGLILAFMCKGPIIFF